ncbi:TRAP transporter substrate-binding protein [Propionimicrobium sp. PCR01-08-3]|uniref:TRAP transporter substrate-binding protein n=1 Tax=Propionimicrobium sp. PCR01-08-3 TaxID=3052086 RepID=UPI00255C7952|nr:TRAP transporter substrate-binding protein [Propionimicrobium sp. PCR01-08-3]WIY82550.1 TRAP transporter substrate-binding protein [Propionimicrobium sp. PCR01-08-3]
MKLSKVILTGAVGLMSLSLAACGGGDGDGGGNAGQTVFKLAFNQTEEHPQYAAGVALGEKLEEATDGRYSVKVYPNEQLGSQADVLQNVSDGTVELTWTGAPTLESYNPDFVVFNLPYMFDSTEAQNAVLSNTDALQDLYTSMEESKSFTVLTGVNAGTRNIYNSKHPITTPADLQGLKIRVQQSDSQVQMIEDMGAISSPMSNGDVYSALQTGVLDGAENNEVTWDALKQSEVAKYYSYTRHLMLPDYLIMSTKALDKMSEEDQAALLEIIPEVQQIANDGFADFTQKSIDHATEIGAEFNDDVDIDAFKATVQPLVEATVAESETRQELYQLVQDANAANPAK